jgi:hypothetical protein
MRLYVNGVLDATATMTTGLERHRHRGPRLGDTERSPGLPMAPPRRRDIRLQAPLRGTEVHALYGFHALQPAPNQPHAPAITAGMPGALQGAQRANSPAPPWRSTARATRTTRSSNTNPRPFRLKAWFRTSGTAGGSILGFGASQTGPGGQRDRHVYVDSGGRITFGVYPGSMQSVRSPGAYNDGALAPRGGHPRSAGMRLYVDGVRVAQNDSVTTAENFTGYRRRGGIDLGGGPTDRRATTSSARSTRSRSTRASSPTSRWLGTTPPTTDGARALRGQGRARSPARPSHRSPTTMESPAAGRRHPAELSLVCIECKHVRSD